MELRNIHGHTTGRGKTNNDRSSWLLFSQPHCLSSFSKLPLRPALIEAMETIILCNMAQEPD